MSERSVVQKLRLKPGQRLYLSSPPEGFVEGLGDLPKGSLATDPAEAAVLLVFVRDAADLEENVPTLVGKAPAGASLWVAYTKTAYRRTDLSRDVIWNWARQKGMDAVASFSIDERWSAIRLKVR